MEAVTGGSRGAEGTPRCSVRPYRGCAPGAEPRPPATRHTRPNCSHTAGARLGQRRACLDGGRQASYFHRSTGAPRAHRLRDRYSRAMSGDVVGILGYGRFGRALGQLFQEAGVAHRAYDPLADVPAEFRASSARAAALGATFIVVAVPVACMHAALTELRPDLVASQVVLDVGSVKVRPAAALSELLGDAIPWCGTHPLFGPLSLALAERPLRAVVCPAPAHFPFHREAASRVRTLYEKIGCDVIEQTPESHDRIMAHTHALTFFVAKGMIDAGAGMEVPFAPPSFQAIARTIETVRSDAGHLFAAIARDNPYAAEARKGLVDALSSIDRALDLRVEAEDSPTNASTCIPDLGNRSPELKQTREHIDALDRDILRLLGQRAQLSQRAAQAKAELGAPVLDGTREAEVMAARRAWADEFKLDHDAVADVFHAIMTMSRRAQRV
ncbi:MAG: prephenate dehydrogenase/arogenate dehydrogenase family protein [Myxococcota bacterium]|nr:prephenate dehydrogenase/arogenate dehydrogenase family protein [Myxococcota bacterium]